MASEVSVITHLNKLFLRDLDKLIDELNTYVRESNLWLVEGHVSNSAGNLALHLIGNLNHFIGATLGNTGYIRKRDLEFSEKHVPRAQIIEKVKDTQRMITDCLTPLSKEDLQQEFRRNPFEDFMSTEYFLLHLLSHLSYHLGQINYHRRLLDT
jgi:uncharacterized damage-inducible protein DinB